MGSTKIEAPSTPAPESTAEQLDAWVENLPTIYETQLQYEPLLMEQQLGLQKDFASELLGQYLSQQQEYAPQLMELDYQLQQQYAPEMARLMAETNAELYPETVALQEQLAAQASEGMQSDVPEWMVKQYQDSVLGQLGENARSGVGADSVARGLIDLNQQYKNYYRDLGLSVTGRSPLVSAGAVNAPQVQTPQYGGMNWTTGYNPQAEMGGYAQTYSPYVGAYASMYNSNAGLAASNNQMMGNIIGGALGGFGTFAGQRWGRKK